MIPSVARKAVNGGGGKADEENAKKSFGSVPLLDMLAEVASATLKSDPVLLKDAPQKVSSRLRYGARVFAYSHPRSYSRNIHTPVSILTQMTRLCSAAVAFRQVENAPGGNCMYVHTCAASNKNKKMVLHCRSARRPYKQTSLP